MPFIVIQVLSATSLIFKMWKSNLVIVQVVHFRPDAFFRLMRSPALPLPLLAYYYQLRFCYLQRFWDALKLLLPAFSGA